MGWSGVVRAAAVAVAGVLVGGVAGAVPLPTGRALTPAGTLVSLGDFPASVVAAGGGLYVADNGQSVGSLQAVDPVPGAPTVTNAPLEPLTPPATNAKPTANSGLLGLSSDGRSMYLPGAALGTLDTFAVGAPGVPPVETSSVAITGTPNTWGAAGTADGDVLVTETFASGGLGPSTDQGDRVLKVVPSTGTVVGAVTVGREPMAIVDGQVPAPDGTVVERAVALDRESGQLSVVDPATMAVVATLGVPRSPAGAVFTHGGRDLLVTCAVDDEVVDVDTATWTVRQVVPVAAPAGPGAEPSAIAVDPSGATAWVTLGPDDALAQLDDGPDGWRLAGEIPTAAYPTGVAYVPATPLQPAQLAVTDGKGVGLPVGTPPGLPEPAAELANPTETGVGVSGSLELIAVPDAAQLGAYSASVRADDVVAPATTGCATPASLAGIRHVVYVIRENKTFDEDLGDTTYGDPGLVEYPQPVTPNLHALVARFALLGNFFSDEEVSDTGHAAVMGGVANDFLQRATQQSYGLGGTRRQGPELGNDDDTNWSPSDFLLDSALAAGLTFRDYGEFYRHDQGDDARAVSPELAAHIVTGFPGFGFDPGTPDTERIAYWRTQFQSDVAAGSFPALEVLYLPEDHTTDNTPTPSQPVPATPQQQVADSDLALGQLVDTLSHSPYWGSTAVFMTEDDPQSGMDHVDDHRTVGLVAGGRVVPTQTTTHYDSGSMLRTIGEILGLRPLTELDATATPMDGLFSPTADEPPYSAVTPSVPAAPVPAATMRAYAAAEEGAVRDVALLPAATQFSIQWEATHGDQPVPAPAPAPAWAAAAATAATAKAATACGPPPGLAEAASGADRLVAAGVAAGVALLAGRRALRRCRSAGGRKGRDGTIGA